MEILPDLTHDPDVLLMLARVGRVTRSDLAQQEHAWVCDAHGVRHPMEFGAELFVWYDADAQERTQKTLVVAAGFAYSLPEVVAARLNQQAPNPFGPQRARAALHAVLEKADAVLLALAADAPIEDVTHHTRVASPPHAARELRLDARFDFYVSAPMLCGGGWSRDGGTPSWVSAIFVRVGGAVPMVSRDGNTPTA